MRLAWTSPLFVAFFLACSGRIDPIDGQDGGTPGGADAGSDAVQTKACAAAGGISLPANTSAPPTYALSSIACDGTDRCWVPVSTTMKNCTTDAECNENPGMSSLAGMCFEGMCMCRAPFHVQPSGKCGTTMPPECTASGGTCRQVPAAECQTGELEGNIDAHMSCGDFAPAVCCYQAATCKTTVDFVCCGAARMPYEPTCVNGWRTCDGPGPTPMLREQNCGP